MKIFSMNVDLVLFDGTGTVKIQHWLNADADGVSKLARAVFAVIAVSACGTPDVRDLTRHHIRVHFHRRDFPDGWMLDPG